MKQTRREFIGGIVETAGAIVLIVGTAAEAEAYLLGTWWLACPFDDCDRIDKVTGGTKQHLCSKCRRQMFYGPGQTKVTIACPEPNLHLNKDVETAGEVKSFPCRTCGTECQMYQPDSRRDPPDRGR